MTWEMPNKHGKVRNILMLVREVQGEGFPDLGASVFQEILDPPAALVPAEALNSWPPSDSDKKKILTFLERG